MKNLTEYKERFYTLMESKMGNVKPLISENQMAPANPACTSEWTKVVNFLDQASKTTMSRYNQKTRQMETEDLSKTSGYVCGSKNTFENMLKMIPTDLTPPTPSAGCKVDLENRFKQWCGSSTPTTGGTATTGATQNTGKSEIKQGPQGDPFEYMKNPDGTYQFKGKANTDMAKQYPNWTPVKNDAAKMAVIKQIFA